MTAGNFTSRRESWRDFGRREFGSWRESCRDRAEILAAGIFSSRRESWRDSWQDPGEILAAGIFASRRESWRDSRQDPGEILAAGNFVSRGDSRREEKSWRPKSRQDPDGIPAEVAEGSRQDPGCCFTRVYFQLDRFILCKIHYSMRTLRCLEIGKFNELIIVPSSKKTKLNSQIIVNYAQIRDCLVHCEHWEHGIAVATEVRSNSVKTKNLISDFSSYLSARTKAQNLRQLSFWCRGKTKNLKLRF